VRKDFDDEYARAVALLPDFGKYLERLIEELLTAQEIPFHGVNHRVKARDSAERKMTRPRKQANGAGPRTLNSVTDLLGIRVVTYYQDKIEDVAALINDQFDVDWENTVDKRAALDADRFGYLSMHYIAKLRPDRIALAEYKKYSGIKFEIQIRSILQHAWAEMEHDLGYKSEAAIPREFRRRLSRLAGILELADDEFVGIREEMGKYQAEAQETIGQGSLSMIEIDQDSLCAFVESNQRITELDELIAGFRKTSVQKRADKQYLGREAGQLVEFGFRSIEDIDNYLEENAALLAKFTEHWLFRTDQAPGERSLAVPAGITLYYARALKTTQEGYGNTAAEAFLANSPDLLPQALHAATADIRSAPGG
jgi:putative GTP pyrophosphokinase